MKLKSLILLCLTISVFNCSKSDDSDNGDSNLPPQSFFLIIDEGTVNETIFNGYDDIATAGIPCQHYGVNVPILESDNLTITNFLVDFPSSLLHAPGTMQSGEFFDNGDGGLSCLAIFRINGDQFLDTSGTFTITSFTERTDDDNAYASGSANLVMSSGFGNDVITHTMRVSFENIQITYYGGC